MKFTIDQIDRGILARFQTVLAAKGYWPDVNNYLPDPFADMAGFKAEKEAIKATLAASGKKLVEPFGVGTSADRLEEQDSHLVVRRKYMVPSQIGFGYSVTHRPLIVDENNPENNTWELVQCQDNLYDVEYEIRFRCNSLQSHRQSDEVVLQALSMRKALKGKNADYTDTEHTFMVHSDGEPNEFGDPDSIERVYRYIAVNLELDDADILNPNVPATVQIDVQTEVAGELIEANTGAVYYGSLPLADIDETNIKTLTKLQGKVNRFNLSFSPTLERMVYAYDKSFGLLLDIQDQYCESIINGFIIEEQTFSIDGGGTVDMYVYYLSGDTTQTDYKLDFIHE